MRLASIFMKKTAVLALTAHLSTETKLLHDNVKDSISISYVPFVNYLLQTYATDSITAEVEPEIVSFIPQTYYMALIICTGLMNEDLAIFTGVR